MEPEQLPFEKENHLNQTFFFGVPNVNFQGCIFEWWGINMKRNDLDFAWSDF